MYDLCVILFNFFQGFIELTENSESEEELPPIKKFGISRDKYV